MRFDNDDDDDGDGGDNDDEVLHHFHLPAGAFLTTEAGCFLPP